MNNQQEVIGIDLGGTKIAFGRFLEDGTCLESLSIPTPQPSTPEAVIKIIAAKINQLNKHKQCVAIGLGTPGATDVTNRIATVAINLSGWHNVPLAEELEKYTGIQTTLANDANCAGVGEAWLGVGKKFQNFVLLTLGTGVGGAIILNGKLFTGHYGTAGELGLISLNYTDENRPCNSGNNGSLEQHCSATAIIRDSGKNPRELGTLAQNGDRQALTFWQNYGKQLGAGIATFMYVLTPEAIILGGGVSASFEFFYPSLMAEIEKRVLPTSREGLQVLKAQLGNDAGIKGAAKLAWDLANNQ